MHRDGPFRLARAGRKGRGVFTARAVAAGDPLFPFEGPRLRREEVVDFARAIQVGADLYLGPSGRIDDYVNHSCDPNAGVRRRGETIELFALRDILAEEEITFDYSTTMTDEPELSDCTCGAEGCRGTIGGVATLSPGALRRLVVQGAVPAFALASLEAASRGGAGKGGAGKGGVGREGTGRPASPRRARRSAADVTGPRAGSTARHR